MMDVYGIFVTILFEWNLSILMFVFYTVVISLGGFLVHFSNQIPVPDFWLQAFKYGKMAHDSKPWKIISLFEVPKRWFVHFYISGSLVAAAAGLQMWTLYKAKFPLSPWTSTLLDILTVQDRSHTVSATGAGICLLLFSLQVNRRLYENLFVSIFSSSQMNILHYIVGHTHYVGAVALLIAEAPGFDHKEQTMGFSPVELHHIIGIFIFFVGFVLQYQSLQILAGLRKNPQKDMNKKHVMPAGGMFEYLSCPHMLAEVLVYVGMLIILQNHIGWRYVTVWVISNQVQVALMNHTWYKKTFKDYPRHRRAIIPFLL